MVHDKYTIDAGKTWQRMKDTFTSLTKYGSKYYTIFAFPVHLSGSGIYELDKRNFNFKKIADYKLNLQFIPFGQSTALQDFGIDHLVYLSTFDWCLFIFKNKMQDTFRVELDSIKPGGTVSIMNFQRMGNTPYCFYIRGMYNNRWGLYISSDSGYHFRCQHVRLSYKHQSVLDPISKYYFFDSKLGFTLHSFDKDGPAYLFVTHDGGVNWSVRSIIPSYICNGKYLNFMGGELNIIDSSTLYLYTFERNESYPYKKGWSKLKSTDGGKTWGLQQSFVNSSLCNWGAGQSFDFADKDHMYLWLVDLSTIQLYYTSNGGGPTVKLQPVSIQLPRVEPHADYTLYPNLATSGGQVYIRPIGARSPALQQVTLMYMAGRLVVATPIARQSAGQATIMTIPTWIMPGFFYGTTTTIRRQHTNAKIRSTEVMNILGRL